MKTCSLAECTTQMPPNPRLKPGQNQFCCRQHNMIYSGRRTAVRRKAERKAAREVKRQAQEERDQLRVFFEADCKPCWLFQSRTTSWAFETCRTYCDGYPIPYEGDPT